MSNWLRNAPIGVKVALAPAFATVCLLAVGLVSWGVNRAMVEDMGQVGRALDGVVGSQRLAAQLADVHQRMYQSMTWEAVGQREEKIKALDAKLIKDLDEVFKAIDDTGADTSVSEADRAQLAAFGKAYAQYRKIALDTLDIKSAGVATAASYVVTLDQQYQVLQDLSAKSVNRQVEIGAQQVSNSQGEARRNLVVVGGVSLLALALAAGLSWLFTRAITRPLAKAARVADALAQGDLSARSDTQGNDETGRVLAALQQVSANLGAIVHDIRSTAQQIDVASSEIASGNADLSSRTENTASALQQTAASVEQLSATIKNSALHAGEANRLARDASAVADEGGTVVAEVVSTMDAINAQAKKIAEIIGTIDGIAFQTNILALNAAVEAARAGEQGRGFSVVAQEVRTLAQRSAEAAREIRSLISSSVEQIDAGAGKVQQAGATMGRIVESIQRVTSTVDSIARAAGEQATGIEQINAAVAEMDRATQQNAAMVEEAAAATDALKSQAGSLVQMLGRFRTHA